jgi:CheY-like chemotaxis protein
MSILVVEDNKASALVLRVNLERSGYQVHVAGDGQAALDILGTQSDVDIVISDIMMPGMDGLALIAAMRGNPSWEHIPVIVASAIADVDTVKQAASLGIRQFIVKPINIPQLLQQIEDVLRQTVATLMGRADAIAKLQIDEATYDELVADLTTLVTGQIAALEQSLAAPDDPSPPTIEDNAAAISETAALLGASQVADTLQELRQNGQEGGARLHLMLHELRRLRRALPDEQAPAGDTPVDGA